MSRSDPSSESEPGSESAEEIILYEKDPESRIATITFNRPHRLNAPTIAARVRYADLLHRAGVDDDVKVLVIRGAGDDLGSGADLPEFMAAQAGDDDEARLAEYRIGPGEVTFPPPGSFRRGATVSQWYANPHSGIRSLQDFKKISILEVKGYCYGWHFYQAADADLVISSDDAMFGHPSFRYHGWGPRMWWWAQTMGVRKFQEMVFTGTDTVFMQKTFFEIMKQFQGEYMGSLLAGVFESLGAAAQHDSGDLVLGDALDRGLGGAVKDNDAKFPPEWRLSKSGQSAVGKPGKSKKPKKAQKSKKKKPKDS